MSKRVLLLPVFVLLLSAVNCPDPASPPIPTAAMPCGPPQIRAQIHINDDDDDANRAADLSHTPVGGEDDLKPLEFKQTGATAVEVYAPQHTGSGRIALWEDAAKTRPVRFGTQYNTPVTFYLEGNVVSSQVDDILFEYQYWRGPSTDPTNAVCGNAAIITVYAITSVVFSALGGSPLTPNPNAGGGQRIFPDKQSSTDPITHERVEVQVVITPAMAGIQLYLRSFDVDDPSSAAAPVDNEGQAEDNRGAPKSGQFAGGGGARTTITTDAAGMGTAQFRVTFQPGDNFRVVAACRDSYLNNLSVRQNDAALARIMDRAGVPVPVGGAPTQGKKTDLLTVWRKLYVELNTMTAPAAGQNTHAGVIRGVAGTADASVFRITLDANLEQVDQYEDGRLTVAGVSYMVIQSTDNAVANDVVDIYLRAGQAAPVNGAAYVLGDDDVTAAPPPLPSIPSMAHMATAYHPAYVDPVAVNSTAPAIPFKKDITGVADLLATLRPGFTLVSANDFWVSHVAAAFQPDASKDLDPDSNLPAGRTTPNPETEPVEGETPPNASAPYSAIYMEVLRESGSNEGQVVAHEVAHQFGALHEGGLMTTRGAGFASPNFVPVTLNRIRTKLRP